MNSFITSAWSLHIRHQQAHQIETLSQARIRGNYPGLSPFPPPCSPTTYFTMISIPWSRKWQPTPVFLPGKSPGQRTLVGYSPWDQKESDITEHHHLHLMGLKAWFWILDMALLSWTLTYGVYDSLLMSISVSAFCKISADVSGRKCLLQSRASGLKEMVQTSLSQWRWSSWDECLLIQMKSLVLNCKFLLLRARPTCKIDAIHPK